MSTPISLLPTAALVDQQAGKCPRCGAELDFGSGEIHDDQYAYDWTCPACQATGKEWHVLVFEEHTVAGEPLDPARVGLQKFTVIGEYWDNQQGVFFQVEAKNDDEARELAQRMCRQGLRDAAISQRDEAIEQGHGLIPVVEDEQEETSDNEPMTITAVFKGWPRIEWLKDCF